MAPDRNGSERNWPLELECESTFSAMRIHRSVATHVVRAPAKLNLFFEVLGKRDDGYHEIETLMCPVDLYDSLYFTEETGGQVELKCERVRASGYSGEAQRGDIDSGDIDPGNIGLGDLPQGNDNFVVRGVKLLQMRAGIDRGLRMRLVKRIPMESGLGGGSSDAAAALVAANAIWNLGFSLDELRAVAAEIGSDVPFFLGGGAAICRGRGERVEPAAGLGSLSFVVVRPPAGLPTAEVYGHCRPSRAPRCVEPLVRALSHGDMRRVGRLLFNRLQPPAERLSPWIERLRHRFAREDCLGHGMSGSGTSYYGLCRHARHARRVAGRLRADGAGSVFAVRSCR